MACPKCGTPDPGPGPFCMSCGFKLPAPPAEAASSPKPLPAPASAAPPSPAAGIPPSAASPSQSVSPSSPSGYLEARDSLLRAASSVQPLASPPIGQMGNVGTVPVSIWGPFAGYGTRGRHVSWLINDQGKRADTLRDAVAARFERRQIPNIAAVDQVKLVRQGVLVDSRPYFLIRRGLTTVGLYIARFGQDLFVSQVTYFKGPISTMRILILAAMSLFALIYPVVYNEAFSQVGVSLFGGVGGNMSNLLFLTCCLGPIYLVDWLVMGILALFSGYKWLTEKDVLAALRVPPNEFDIDDTVALEKSVEQTVRESLDVVGIEQRLMPQAAEYGMRRRLI